MYTAKQIKMDFLSLVLLSYFNGLNQKNISGYFRRECKKAARDEFYSSQDFYTNCLQVVDFMEADLVKQVNDHKRELYLLRDVSRDEETLNDAREELDTISTGSYTVNLFSLTKGKFPNTLYGTDLEQIKMGILFAWYHDSVDEFLEYFERVDLKSQSETIKEFYITVSLKNMFEDVLDIQKSKKEETLDNESGDMDNIFVQGKNGKQILDSYLKKLSINDENIDEDFAFAYHYLKDKNVGIIFTITKPYDYQIWLQKRGYIQEVKTQLPKRVSKTREEKMKEAIAENSINKTSK